MKMNKAALAVLLGGASLVAVAATPESGTLTLHSGAIEFGSGPNIGVNPTPAADPVCLEGALPCDHFDLTIDLPENIGDVFPSSQIRMTFAWDDLVGLGVDDYDIYLYDANGNLISSSATSNNPEFMGMIALGGVRDFRFDIVYFSVVGSSYTGTVELVLGDPAEDADVEEFYKQNSVLARYLGSGDSQESAADNAYTQRRTASGALNVMLLSVLAMFGWRRRRIS